MTLQKANKLYYKMIYHAKKLQEALNAAHEAKLIFYNPDKFSEESPCAALWKCEERINITTEKQIAMAFRADINKLYYANRAQRKKKKVKNVR